MGYEDHAPLLGNNDHRLTEQQKDFISRSVGRRLAVVRTMSPVASVLFFMLAVGLLITCGVVQNAYLLLRVIPAVFVLVVASISAWTQAQAAQRKLLLLQDMFGHSYVGSWVYEKDTWIPFARQYYELPTVVRWMLRALFILFVLLGLGLFFGLYFGLPITNIRPAIFFTYTGLPPIAIGVLMLVGVYGTLYYLIYRRFNPTTHCCILSKGSLYIEGEYIALVPRGAALSQHMYSLDRIDLSQTQVGTGLRLNVLSFHLVTLNRYGQNTRRYLQCPVPTNTTPSVATFVPDFAREYASSVYVSPELLRGKEAESCPAPTVRVQASEITL